MCCVVHRSHFLFSYRSEDFTIRANIVDGKFNSATRKGSGNTDTRILAGVTRRYQRSPATGSERLAMELAIRFAKRWPSVLDNLSGIARRIFTLEELQALYESGLGLHEDAKAVGLPKEWYTTDEGYIAPWLLEELEKQDSDFEDSQGEISLPASVDAASSPSVPLKRKSPRKRAVPPGEKENKSALIKEANTEMMTEADSVQSALAEMEPVLREVFLLSAASYSPTEITRLLGYEERTVTTYLSQAREQFRRLYHMVSKYR